MFDSYGFGSFGGTLGKKRFGLDIATSVATALVQLPGVIRVEVYGGISREGRGNDIDLLLVVDNESLYQKFISGVHERIKEDIVGHELGPRLRLASIIGLWGEEWLGVENWPEQPLLDMFVMPSNWHDRLSELQGDLPHDDPQFLENIQFDAYVLASR